MGAVIHNCCDTLAYDTIVQNSDTTLYLFRKLSSGRYMSSTMILKVSHIYRGTIRKVSSVSICPFRMIQKYRWFRQVAFHIIQKYHAFRYMSFRSILKVSNIWTGWILKVSTRHVPFRWYKKYQAVRHIPFYDKKSTSFGVSHRDTFDTFWKYLFLVCPKRHSLDTFRAKGNVSNLAIL